jgi:hypothetical protein
MDARLLLQSKLMYGDDGALCWWRWFVALGGGPNIAQNVHFSDDFTATDFIIMKKI